MNESKCHLTVIYVVLPLVILSFCLGPAVLALSPSAQEENIDLAAYEASLTMSARPVSLMTPFSSGNLYEEVMAVREVFSGFNTRYWQEDGLKVDIHWTTGSRATLSQMQSYIRNTERMHLTTHGSYNYDDGGPKLLLYGGYLTARVVDRWTGLNNGRCRLVYLSACNGIGEEGATDTALTQALIDKTSIETVLAFNHEIGVHSASVISQYFWMFHLTYSRSGGLSARNAWSATKDHIRGRIASAAVALAFIVGLSVKVAIGYIAAYYGLTAAGKILLGQILGQVVNYVGVNQLLAWLNGELLHALAHFQFTGNAYVPGMLWPSSSGGGGSGPIHVVH